MKAQIWKTWRHPLSPRGADWHWQIASLRNGPPILNGRARSWQDALAAVQTGGHNLTGKWL